MGRNLPENVSWALKPHADPAAVADRLATIAQQVAETSDGARTEAIAAAAQLASESFLDPAISAAVTEMTDVTVPRTADDQTTMIRIIAQHVTPSAPAPRQTETWPSTAAGGERALHFRLVRSLREGGMGSVFLAWDERLDRHVVLKRLAPAQDSEESRQRLEREARAAARLRHPHIVTIYSLEYIGPDPILVQEYVEGEDLDESVGKLTPADALHLARLIAEAVAYAHARRIVHRDLKPHNIRVRPDGTPVVLDFGLGKAFAPETGDRTAVELTKSGIVLGTPHYMAPEQWTAGELTPAVDVFAFGVLLYELLAGTVPFDGESSAGLYAAILRGNVAVERLAVPPDVQNLIRECLSTEARDRPSMAGVLTRLARATATPITVEEPAIEPQEIPAVLVPPADHSGWISAQREHAYRGLSAVVTLEITVAFREPMDIRQLKQLLKPLARNDARIGRVGATRKLRGGQAEITAPPSTASDRTYWAAQSNGELYYLAVVPQLPSGAITIEVVLDDIIHVLAYVARYASAIGAGDDAHLITTIHLRGVGNCPMVSAEWSERFTATLATLRTTSIPDLRSAAVLSLAFLRDQLAAAVELLTKELIAKADFLTLSSEHYARRVAALGY